MSNALDHCDDATLRFDRASPNERSGLSMPERIAAFSGTRPLNVLPRAWGARLSAACWRFTNATLLQPRALDEIVLGCRTAGTATVIRSAAGHSVRKRPGLGSLSLMNPAQDADWLVDGTCEVVHVYIPRGALQDFSRRAFGSDLSHLVREFVGVRSAWLGAYFQMLGAEIDFAAHDAGPGDPLFLAETEAMLIRHLIEWQSDADHGDLDAMERGRPVPALRRSVLRRVQDYIQANLAGDIHLEQLAAVACMSEDHFLRSFRAACGTTPYQYVIEKRVEKAARLLAETRIPINQVARECGFKSAPQLSSRFRAVTGQRPSRYRASA